LINKAEPRHRAAIDFSSAVANTAAVITLVTGVGPHDVLPGAYWSGGRLSHLVWAPAWIGSMPWVLTVARRTPITRKRRNRPPRMRPWFPAEAFPARRKQFPAARCGGP